MLGKYFLLRYVRQNGDIPKKSCAMKLGVQQAFCDLINTGEYANMTNLPF